MFDENIETIKSIFSECKGSGMYFAIFFISILYILIKEKDKNKKILLGYFPLLVLFIILNPLFNKLINPFVNKNVYFRMFWLLPMGLCITYASVDVINSLEKTKNKIFALLGIILIIVFSGKLIYNKENYQKVHNWYKVPDQAKWVTQIITEDDLENKKVMLPETLVPYIRQINSDIELAYPRQPFGYGENEMLIQLHSGNVEYVVEKCKEKNCNYIIFENNVKLSDDMSKYGYELLGQTYSYNIYKLVK